MHMSWAAIASLHARSVVTHKRLPMTRCHTMMMSQTRAAVVSAFSKRDVDRNLISMVAPSLTHSGLIAARQCDRSDRTRVWGRTGPGFLCYPNSSLPLAPRAMPTSSLLWRLRCVSRGCVAKRLQASVVTDLWTSGVRCRSCAA